MPHLFQKLPPLSSLVAFEAAFRHGSFTRAADELALSQASISRRIRELEEDLGVTLFERRRYDVDPTTEGERLARVARPALNEIADTVSQLRAVNEKDNSLTVFSDICLGSSLVAPVVGEFQRLHPGIDLRILASYDSIATTTEEFDFGLQYGSLAPNRYDISPMMNERVFPVCTPEIAKKLGKKPTLNDLLDFTLIHLTGDDKTWTGWPDLFAEHGVDYPEGNESSVFNSYQVCLEVAEQGDGIALGWATTVKDRIERGGLVALEPLASDLGDVINLYRPRDRKTTAAAETFIELMRKRLNPEKSARK